MKTRKAAGTAILFCITFFLNGQTGTVRGTVSDGTTGETLPGVIVSVAEAKKGTATDLDGKFALQLTPGKYDLKISFISYESLNISGVTVKEGEVTMLDDLLLKEAGTQLAEVTITAEMIRNTENALLLLRKNSANVVDGISAASFRKIGDGDAAASIKRVSGVSVSGGKYVYVRGLGDRYTKTILNGVDIPGLDPDRNTLQMDIFPTSTIDNMIVHKSFVAELPADFTGGVVDIELKDFPEKKTANIGLSGGYNSRFHFNNNYLTYEGSKTDMLGFDDGTRAIPATSNLPFFAQAIGQPKGAAGTRYQEVLSGFSPHMSAFKRTSFMDYSLGADFGNQVARKRATLGYNFVLSYKNTTEFFTGAEYARYGLSGNPDVNEMEVRELQKGDYGTNSVLLSGMGGFAIKTRQSKYRINLLHLQNGESGAGIFDYTNADQGAIFYGYQHNLSYSQRSLSNLLISGEHKPVDSRHELQWKLSPSYSTMSDPDVRFTRYEIRGDQFVIGTEAGFPQRIWRDLEEMNVTGQVNAVWNFDFRKEKAKLRYGVAHTYKQRDYIIRNFNFNVRNVPLTGDPDELFFPENLWPYEGSIIRGTTYEAAFMPVNPNQFNANVHNSGAYASVEISPLKNIRAIAGLRAENYVQRYTGQDQLGNHVLQNERVLNDLDFFPTINLVCAISDNQNLRTSYARTIARPSLKELSYAEIFDPITGRTFIGGLFRDANDQAGIVYWDGKLVSTSIDNADLRWELFQTDGRMISGGVFYKRFRKPIEIVQFATEAGSFQPRNVGDGNVMGAEMEVRQSLKPVARSLENISVNVNLTVARSAIRFSETEYQSRVANARNGQVIGRYRDMAGQAPYLINAGLSYKANGKVGALSALEAGLFYNVQGPTLQYVGMVDRPDIYTVPFHSLNFNANTAFGRGGRIKAGVLIENIAGEKSELVYRSFGAEEQFFTRLDPGTRIQVKLSYVIF